MQQIDAVHLGGPVLLREIPAAAGHPVVPAPSIVSAGACGKICDGAQEHSTPVSPKPLRERSGAGRPVRRSEQKEKVHPVSPQRKARPHSVPVTRRISKSYPFIEQDIPLYLVPHIIARAIWQRGEGVYRISVIRTKRHYYTIRLRIARQVNKAAKKSRHKEAVQEHEQGLPGKHQ